MTDHTTNGVSAQLNAATISTEKKEKHLLAFNEDDFRDLVVRPIYMRKGLTFVRHTCGSDEEGKDCVFLGADPLGTGKPMTIAMQTKRGNINLASKAADNLLNAETQLRTALATDISLTAQRQKVKPDLVVLCASGKINEAARRHIQDKIIDTRLRFVDSTDIIPDIDALYPEFWYGIDATKFPYLRQLKELLLGAQDTILVPMSMTSPEVYTAITHENYVDLYLDRITSKTVTKTKTIPLPHKHVRRETVHEKELTVDQISVTGLLDRPDRLVLIVGEGGSGKTTALRHLAFRIADGALKSSSPTTIPIIVKAADLSHVPGRLVENLATITGAVIQTVDVPFTVNDLECGSVSIFIDALDEVTSAEAKTRVMEKIVKFNAQYPQCLVVLTTRQHTYLNEHAYFGKFIRYDLSCIDMRQASQIIEHVTAGRKLPRETAQEVVRRLQNIHGMELSPMLVALFVATTDFTRKDIPANITEVFSKFTEQMLGRWDERKGLNQQFQYNLKDVLLCAVAFHMHSRKARTMSRVECRQLFEEFLQKRGYEEDVEKLFDETIYRSGLLREEGETIEFRHHLVQEFFAGRGAPSVEFFKTVIVDEWWRNAAVFFFGANQKNSQRDILELADALSGRVGADLYRGAVTVGLAIQACYLAETKDKVEILIWVIDAFAETNDSFCDFLQQDNVKFPLHGFVHYYMQGRDSVGCDTIAEVMNWYQSQTPLSVLEKRKHEIRIFWCLVGLIESGNVAAAEPIIRDFKPSDDRLLVALFLGCLYITHQRIVNPNQKEIAKAVQRRLLPKITPMISQILEEHKGILLERRHNQIRVLDTTENKLSGEFGLSALDR